MYSWKMNGRTIDIKLDPGIYRFGDKSATGKSYLRKLMKEAEVRGIPVLGYNYDDELLAGDLVRRAGSKDYKVILVDRYERYAPKYREFLKEFAKSGIVLIDHKNANVAEGKLCFIYRSPNAIEVTE